MSFLRVLLVFLRAVMIRQSALAAENLAHRQQLAVLERTAKRPRLQRRDRLFWVWLSRLWRDWWSVLVFVQPDTVVRWHREGFKLYWRWKSRRGQVGRPKIERELRDLIRRICRENPTWGAPRIQSELRLLGHTVVESTVARYMVRSPKPPSPTWRTFLDNHVPTIAAVDVLTVPSVLPSSDASLSVHVVASHLAASRCGFQGVLIPAASHQGHRAAISLSLASIGPETRRISKPIMRRAPRPSSYRTIAGRVLRWTRPPAATTHAVAGARILVVQEPATAPPTAVASVARPVATGQGIP